MRIRKFAVGAGIATALVVGGGGVAGAEHVHSLETGNGSCVLLAQNGGEKDVILPFVTSGAAHPLHVNVHKGEPGMGERLAIGVYDTGTDPCGGQDGSYVNDRTDNEG